MRTLLIEKYTNRYEAEIGVYIDIFPIDPIPGDLDKAVKCFKKKEFQRDLIVASNWKKFQSKKENSIIRESARFIFFVLSRFSNIKSLLNDVETFYTSFEWDKCEYAGNVVDGTWGTRNVMPKSIFERYCELLFEGRKYLCIAEYDSFLANIYGNYMELPPEDKRVTHHTFSAYWKNDILGAE